MANSACTSYSTESEALSINNRQVIFDSQADSGILLLPGQSSNITFEFSRKEYPVRQRVRVTGYGVYPEPFTKRGEAVFRNFAFHIDDYLDSTITYNEKYSLVFMGDGGKEERNAFYRLSEDELKPFKGRANRIEIPLKTGNLKVPESGYLIMELQLYKKKAGRHPDDIYDNADRIIEFRIPENHPEWFVYSGNFELPDCLYPFQAGRQRYFRQMQFWDTFTDFRKYIPETASLSALQERAEKLGG
jgi:hypothetical protein